MSNELYHWGIKGMHWGVRRFQNKDGSLTQAGRKRYADDGDADRSTDSTNNSSSTSVRNIGSNSGRKSVRDMSDSELREAINRLNMEKQYKDLITPKTEKVEKKSSAAKQFIGNVLRKSGENIASQLVTFAMGEAVNVTASKIGAKTTNATLKSILDPEKGPIVNSKKGQKDK